MYSLHKLLWLSFLGIGGLLLLIIILGGRQMQLNRQFSKIISQSEQTIFHFSTIRESITASLTENQWGRLEQVIPEIETFNSRLARMQEDTFIPAEFRLNMIDKIDMPGLVISLKKVIGGVDRAAEQRRLQDQLRTIADHLLRFDRIIVGQARVGIVDLQKIIIGIMGLGITFASFILIMLYRDTAAALVCLTSEIRTFDFQEPTVSCPKNTCREVADLHEAINGFADRMRQTAPEIAGLERQEAQAMLAETINETTNQLNGIMNYAQLLSDTAEEEALSEEKRVMLRKIIEGGTKIASVWKRITL
jgi:hypothetical protein